MFLRDSQSASKMYFLAHILNVYKTKIFLLIVVLFSIFEAYENAKQTKNVFYKRVLGIQFQALEAQFCQKRSKPL